MEEPCNYKGMKFKYFSSPKSYTTELSVSSLHSQQLFSILLYVTLKAIPLHNNLFQQKLICDISLEHKNTNMKSQKQWWRKRKKKLPVRASQVTEITTATERKRKAKKEFQWVLGILRKWSCDLWHSAEGLVLTMLPSLPVFICPDTRSS